MVMMAAGGACFRELLPIELAHGEGYTYGGNVQEGGYFNTLISPVIGLPCKGMLFFQGESEGGSRELAERYAYDLTLLVADERARFGQSFPFYNVQLSDYREEGTRFFPWHDIIRIQQFKALSLIPNSTLTVDMDLGAPEDYEDWPHSPRKMELGERLALLVLAKEYGISRETECSSPRPVMATLTADCKQIVVEFTDISAGLIVSGHNPADSYGMEVQGFSVGDYPRPRRDLQPPRGHGGYSRGSARRRRSQPRRGQGAHGRGQLRLLPPRDPRDRRPAGRQ